MAKAKTKSETPKNTTHGAVGTVYELEDGGALDLNPYDFVENSDSDIPDHRLAEIRRSMIAYVANGADPDRVASVFYYDNWRDDAFFADLVERARNAAIAQVEMQTWRTAATGGSIPTGIQFWLKARAGYNDRPAKDEEDALPQEININRKVVRGDTKEDDVA